MTKLNDEVTCYKPGTSVIIGKDVPGIIDYIIITSNGVCYSITWWNGRERKDSRFYEYEFTTDISNQKLNIGFV